MTDTAKVPVERKVKAATVASVVAGIVLALLTWLQDNPALITALPDTIEGIVWLLVPSVLVFAAGYAAPHTPRSVRHVGNDPTRR
jgi:hypothetical protein